MPDIKIEGKLTSAASQALGLHAQALYDTPGATRLAIVEIKAAWNETPAPDEAKKPAVHARIVGMEIGTDEQEDDLRRAQRALYRLRTARGTLDESDQLEVIPDTALGLLGEMLHEREAVRLRAGLRRWLTEMHRVAATSDLTPGKVRQEYERIHDGLEALLHPARVPDDGE